MKKFNCTEQQFAEWFSQGKRVNGNYVNGYIVSGYKIPSRGFVMFLPCIPEEKCWNDFFEAGGRKS